MMLCRGIKLIMASLIVLLMISASLHAQQSSTVLLVGTWGGPYEAAQRRALFEPFERTAGIDINTRDYTGGLDIFNESTALPDILDMLEEEANVACAKGLLKSINHAILSQAADISASHASLSSTVDDFQVTDFHKGVFSPCSVAHLTFSTLIAYDERAFTAEKPTRIENLFDLQRFPGKRALQRSPAALFEWAMMAEGIPVSQIYDLLSTERGLRLVLRKLESLRGHVIWWDKPAEAVALLERGEVVMASGYNGRFFEAWSRGVPINMIWDGQILDRSVWALPIASTADESTALAFLRFALHPQRLAHVARQIPYGPLRASAFGFIGLHPDTGIVMSDHLPTAAHHLTNALQRDTHWYARTSQLRESFFSRWLND